MKLDISDNIHLPLDSVTQTFAILAKRRVGKTYTASVIAEEFVRANLPFVVLDPTGAWWGLRSGKNGKAKGGLPVYIIGGQKGIPLESTAGSIIAEQVAIHPSFYIIDVSQFESNSIQDRFATEFAERLYRIKERHREPLHLFIDEADSFIPQRPIKGQERMLGAFEALVRRGGIRGIGVTLISQRPAVINKNVLTQTECLIVLQTTAPQDQDAIDEWVKRNGTEENRKILMSSLASLQKGEAWIWSPAWLEIFKRINIRERNTFNSSATPKINERKVVNPTLTVVDMEKLSEQINATIKDAKENDPRELKKTIRELQIELKKKSIPVPQIQSKQTDQKQIDKAIQQVRDQYESQIVKAKKEINIICQGLAKEIVDVYHAVKALQEIKFPAFTDKIDKLALFKAEARKELILPLKQNKNYKYELAMFTKTGAKIGIDKVNKQDAITGISLTSIPPHVYNADKITVTENNKPLPSGAKRLLEVLVAWYPNSLTEGHWRSNAGLRKTGTFSNYKSLLITKGLIDKNGDKYQATENGINWFGDNKPIAPQTTEEVLALWNPKLPDGARRILEVLIRYKGEYIPQEEVLEQAILRKTGTFSNYKSMLITAKLIKKNGNQLAADKETLFL